MGKKDRNRTAKKRPTTTTEVGSADGSSIGRKWTLALVLTVTFLVFANSLGNGFAYDDNSQILENKLLRNFSNIPLVFTEELWFWRVLQDQTPGQQEGPTTPYYRPMFTLFQMLCWHLFETWSGGWHLVSILIHLGVVYFVFMVLEKVTGDLRLSAVASLLFAVHPLRSESVAWISGISDPLLAVFLLPSFYLYLKYRDEGKIAYLASALVVFLLAAFAKEPAVALPIFVAAYEVVILNQDSALVQRLKRAALFSSLFFLMSVVYFSMRYKALGFVLSDPNYTDHPIPFALLTIPLVIWKYLGLLFWPVNLSVFHATPLVKSPLELRFIFPVIGLVALALVLWRIRKSKAARFAILWFFVHLLPVLNLRAFSEDFLVQERYVYIPSIGFSLLIAIALVKLPVEKWLTFRNRRTAQASVAMVIVLIMGGKTFAQNPVWNDDDTLWVHGVESSPDQTMAYYILGQHYLKRQKYAQAVDTFEQYLRLEPNNLVIITNLASARLVVYESQVASRVPPDRTHIDRAIALCEQGLKAGETNAALWDTLGRAYTYDTELKNLARARSCFWRALEIEPELMLANLHLGFTYLKEGNMESAMSYLEKARVQQPEFPDTYKFLGHAYAGQGKHQEAMKNISLYLELQPNALDAPNQRQFIEELRVRMQKAAQSQS